LIDEVLNVGVRKSISRFNLAEAEIDIFQLAAIDKTHDLISRGLEQRGCVF
jgi:hypothetical protein